MFVRKDWAMANDLSLIPLPCPRPLYLADGRVSELITHRVVGSLESSNHVEEVIALATTFGPDHDIILGFPWLERHNPSINWWSKTVKFDKEFCTSNCLIPRNSNLNSNYRAPYIEEMPDQGYVFEPEDNTSKFQSTPVSVTPFQAKPTDTKQVKQASVSDRKNLNPPPKVFDKINSNGNCILNAPEFFQMSRQEDIRIMHIMAEDLVELGERETSLKIPD
ncbi:hypothetical protein K3495_g7123 [Podosphaera aphanis]|nr:hypothetical protein K3495_g7123 [Podosphaera aphanis]